MAEVIMTCGKICSGKSTYAKKICGERKGVVLSVDEITLALFKNDTGDMHDTYVERAEEYLFEKSLEIVNNGIDVILDWGFWQKREREYARKFYSGHGVDCQFHYIDISDEEWKRRIEKRNGMVERGEISAYYIDEGLAKKAEGFFEKPDDSEIAVRIKSDDN